MKTALSFTSPPEGEVTTKRADYKAPEHTLPRFTVGLEAISGIADKALEFRAVVLMAWDDEVFYFCLFTFAFFFLSWPARPHSDRICAKPSM
jgi:hypothetical protein